MVNVLTHPGAGDPTQPREAILVSVSSVRPWIGTCCAYRRTVRARISPENTEPPHHRVTESLLPPPFSMSCFNGIVSLLAAYGPRGPRTTVPRRHFTLGILLCLLASKLFGELSVKF